MAGNSWSINIVKGSPCSFDPDVYCPPGTPKPTVLTAETNDSISWNNLTSKAHQICTGQGDAQTQLTNRIPKHKSSDAYSPQATGTIDYYCCLHDGETGTIEVVS
jgi:plastocyanin